MKDLKSKNILSSQNKSGQTTIEYLLLLGMVAAMYTGFLSVYRGLDLEEIIRAPFEKEYAAAFRYGHVQARGSEQGGPSFIALSREPGNFRVFVNPRGGN